MTPTQSSSPEQSTSRVHALHLDADAARLRRDIEALKARCGGMSTDLPWNTYFDELIQRGPAPRERRR